MNLRGDGRINEGERDGCGERMATILEERSSNRRSKSSKVNIMSISDSIVYIKSLLILLIAFI